ncbi:MAG: DUF4178 domain-containing protein [Chitinophagaceae bacterium]|nr:MAG: DUF4178 domain-containing protein [Chitinophagaceae bacterium]
MVPSLLACPRCGTPHRFAHPQLNVAVCTCDAVLRLYNERLEPLGNSAISHTVEPLQPGTSGSWEGRPFTLCGRVRCQLEGSVFNYWALLFDDGELALLGEGYGLYVLLRPKGSVDLDSGELDHLKIGRNQTVNGAEYTATARESCERWEAEGVAWLPLARQSFRSFVLSAAEGGELWLFEWARNEVQSFDAVWVNANDLHFGNTRPSLLGEAFSMPCPSCNKTVTLQGLPYAQSGACAHCGKHFRRNDRGTITKGDSNGDYSLPDLPLGSKGRVFGADYEIVGFAVKEEQNAYHARWREYVLWNEWEGYAFLSEFDGHWIFLRERGEGPVIRQPAPDTLVFDKEPYQKYNRYHYKVVFATGSFPYDIDDVESTEVYEYISPPEMWSCEIDKRACFAWYHGQHIAGRDLSEAFAHNGYLPPKQGVGAVEPRAFIAPGKIALVAGAGIVFLLLLHLLLTWPSRNHVLLDENLTFDNRDTVSLSRNDIYLDRDQSNVEVEVWSPVTNSWVEVSTSLIDKRSGQEYGLEQGVEYYEGYDGGESWSEGSRHESGYLTAVPAGNYLLQLQVQREPMLARTDSARVRLTYDVPMMRNFWLSLLTLLGWPLVTYLRVRSSERSRWYNSPFTPFNYDEES